MKERKVLYIKFFFKKEVKTNDDGEKVRYIKVFFKEVKLVIKGERVRYIKEFFNAIIVPLSSFYKGHS